MAVTLNDIARKSGTSVSTVSRILNKKSAKYRISSETEKLVLKTAKDLNYSPNQLARSLRLKRTHTIGLIVPDISNPFFACLMKSIQISAHQLGYGLLVCDTNEELPLEVEHARLLSSKGVDGLIILPVGQKSAHLEALMKSEQPLVIVDRIFETFEVNSVVVDNYHGASEAVDHLIENGHTRIAIIQGLPDTFTTRERLRGYKDTLARHEIPVAEELIVGKDFRQENGYIETKVLLRIANPPTALFTTSDLITLGALQAISEEGLSVPGDVSIVAFDDFDSAPFFRCPITAVSQPRETMGEMAVKLLLDQVKSQNTSNPKRIVLKPRLVVRDSVKNLLQPAVIGTSMA